MQLRTGGVHYRESAGTGPPVNLKVVPNECCLGRSSWSSNIQYSTVHGSATKRNKKCSQRLKAENSIQIALLREIISRVPGGLMAKMPSVLADAVSAEVIGK